MAEIVLIPWDRDCMAGLADFLLTRFTSGLDKAVVVFPHRRPKRYLIRTLLADPRFCTPAVLPRILSIGELFAETAGRLGRPESRLASELDMAGLAFDAVSKLRQADVSLAMNLPGDLAGFFPWGLRLARLFEEMARHGLSPEDMLYPGDDLMPQAAALLGRLGAIHREYLGLLAERDMTTPGLELARIAADSEAAAAQLSGARLVACGFYALTPVEEALLKTLWRDGQADIVWHTDPALAEPGAKAHWSCARHKEWLRDWRARAVLWPGGSPRTGRAPAIRYLEGFDLHSQLRALGEDLSAAASMEGRAVIVPDPAMLMPVLHHLPSPDANISMGYPVSRTPLSGLAATVFELQQSKVETPGEPDRYYWRDMIALIRHPYLRMLGEGQAAPLRILFSAMEADIRRGGKHLDPYAWRPDSLPGEADFDHEAALALAHRVFDACLLGFSGLSTLSGLARALSGLAGLLLDSELRGDIWERFLIDAEALARLTGEVIPALGSALVAETALTRETLFAVAGEILSGQTISFEADPITALQVLGPLEARLLHFSAVHVLGANDDLLPGPAASDPLTPDSLRRELGLPDSAQRDFVAAHNFFSLLAGADEVTIYYSSGVSGGSLFDDKSVRSRFVEELVFAEESRLGRLIRPGEPPVATVVPRIGAAVPAPRELVASPAMRERLSAYVAAKPLSARFFDAYLTCPERFFYLYLTPVREPEEVSEDGDPAALGEIVHESLGEYFGARLGRPQQPGRQAADELASIYLRRLAAAPVHRQAAHDQRLLMERFGAARMREYGLGFPPHTPLACEIKLTTSIETPGRSILVTGVVDRIDRRDEGEVIVDYKTGQARPPRRAFFSDENLFSRLETADPDDYALFCQAADAAGSVQLPLYALLRLRTGGELPADAGFALLREGGREARLFGTDAGEDYRRRAIAERTPALLGYLAGRMLGASRFEARPNPGCGRCPYRRVCAAGPEISG